MANKRMFTLKVVDSDAFLEMSQTSQLLYFHLGMRVDDDGFVGNPKRIMRMIGSSEDDIKILFAKKFIIGFASGVIVIKHHRMNNNWDKYNCKRTQYLDEFKTLHLKDNGSYTTDLSQGLPVQTETRLKPDLKQSLEEKRIEENRIEIPTLIQNFEKFWKLYPKKKNKKKAGEVWKKANISEELFEIIMDHLKQRVKTDWIRENCRYVIYPERFIKNELWNDDLSDYKELQEVETDGFLDLSRK